MSVEPLSAYWSRPAKMLTTKRGRHGWRAETRLELRRRAWLGRQSRNHEDCPRALLVRGRSARQACIDGRTTTRIKVQGGRDGHGSIVLISVKFQDLGAADEWKSARIGVPLHLAIGYRWESWLAARRKTVVQGRSKITKFWEVGKTSRLNEY